MRFILTIILQVYLTCSVLRLATATRKQNVFFTYLPKNEVICIALCVEANHQMKHLSGHRSPPPSWWEMLQCHQSVLTQSVRRALQSTCQLVVSTSTHSYSPKHSVVGIKGVCNVCNKFSTLFQKWLSMGLCSVTEQIGHLFKG